MQNIFVFGNSFATKNIISSFSYLFNECVQSVYVLGENHRQKDFKNLEIDIIVNDNIEYCLSNCDLILLLFDKNIPEKSVNYIKKFADSNGKRFIKLNNPWFDDNFELPKTYNDLIQFPSILIVSLGKISQGYYTEMIINQIFSEKDIFIKQLFLDSTSDLLLQIDDVKLLNAALHDQIQNECQKYEVVIYSVNIRENNVSDLKQCIEFAKKTSPDFIILQADFNYNFNQIKPIIEYNLCTKIDILIKSNFMLYDRDFVYCQSDVDEKMLYCESDNFMNTLSKKIFSKISFPEGCIVI